MLDAQIIALASSGAAPEEIAASLGLERGAVEFTLARHGLIEEEDIPKEDYQEILNGIIQTAKYSEHEHLKLRAGMFIVEQRRTRENLKHAPAMNVMLINNLIQNSHNKVLASLQVVKQEDDLDEITDMDSIEMTKKNALSIRDLTAPKDPARDLE